MGGPGNREQKEDMVPALKELATLILSQRSRMCPWKWFAAVGWRGSLVEQRKPRGWQASMLDVSLTGIVEKSKFLSTR